MDEITETEKEAMKKRLETTGDPCANITDPVRRGLCRVCQAPVIGEAPFCKEHEPPVP
jgi:hypothetical protein